MEAYLLPWKQGGVDFLLAESDLPPEFSLCHEKQRQAPARPAPTAPPPRRESYAPSPAAVPQRRPDPAATPRPAVSPVHSPPSPAAPENPAAPALAPELWPRPWRERLKATRPAPVLWTYWALGQDLCGTADPRRRDLLKRLLGDLGHPGGTHTFWPAALPSPQDWDGLQNRSADDPAPLHAHAEAFWGGVELLKARALVVMGSPAVKALELPPRLRPFQQTRHRGKLVVVLRDADVLVEEQHHYDAVREFLRRALASFGR